MRYAKGKRELRGGGSVNSWPPVKLCGFFAGGQPVVLDERGEFIRKPGVSISWRWYMRPFTISRETLKKASATQTTAPSASYGGTASASADTPMIRDTRGGATTGPHDRTGQAGPFDD